MNWKKLEDHQVNHVWHCPECGEVADIAPGWYQDNGTPTCVECDQDMLYEFTEVKT